MYEYENLRRIGYGDDTDGWKLFVPVCPKCSRYVKADKECFVNNEKEPNATCKTHGRVRMPDEGWF